MKRFFWQKFFEPWQDRRKSAGFTLIELLLYIAVSSIILTAVSGLFVLVLQYRIKNQTVAEVEQQGIQVLQIMTQIVRNAGSIPAPTPGNAQASLTVDVVSAALDPTVFDISGGVIRITEDSDGTPVTTALTSSRLIASDLSFENLAAVGEPDSLRIRFTLTHVNNTDRNEYTYTKTFETTANIKDN